MANTDCKEPGRLVPIVNRARCEAKGDCVEVCPYHVFEIQPLARADIEAMSWLGRLKARVHGNKQAYVVRGGDCHACGACVSACPEDAIQLRSAG